MIFNVNTAQPVALAINGEARALSNNRVIEFSTSGDAQLSFSIWDNTGTELISDIEVISADEPRYSFGYNPWHIRDDGDGAFTLFVNGTSGRARDYSLVTRSFDAEGRLVGSGTYEPLDFDKPEGQAAVDVGDGRVLAIVNTGDRVQTRLYNEDGTLAHEGLWNANETGAGSSRGANLNFTMTRSGETSFVFYINDDAHSPLFDEERIYMARIADNGVPVNYGTRTPVDTLLPTLPFVVPRGGQVGMLDSATLADGRVVLVYAIENQWDADGNRPDPDTGVDIYMRMFNADGTFALEETRINQNMLGEQNGVRVYAQDDGTFVVLYQNVAPRTATVSHTQLCGAPS